MKIALENLANQGLLSLNIKSEKQQSLTFSGIEQKSQNFLDYELNELSKMLIRYGLEEKSYG